jgi:hypothetical protein
MKKELYLVLGLLVGFGAGWYVNSSLKYDKFIDRIEEQIMENKERRDYSEKDRSKLREKLELKIIDWDNESKAVFAKGDDGKDYKIEYDEVLLKGIISERRNEK